MSQEDEDVIKVTLIGVAKGRNGHLDVLANFAPEIDDPDEIDSVIIDYEPVSDDGEVTHEHEGWLTAMVQADSGELFTVSVDGELVRFKAGKFKVTKLGVDSALNDITLVPGAGYVAVGDKGVLLEAKGLDTKPQRLDVGPDLYGVRAVAPTAMVAVGDEGCVLYGDGASWRKVVVPTNACLFAVAMVDAQNFHVGGQGVLLHFTPKGIEEIDIPRETTIYALAWHEGKLYLAAGEEGLFSLAADGSLQAESDEHMYSLQVVGELLAAMGNHLMLLRQAGKWTRHAFEF